LGNWNYGLSIGEWYKELTAYDKDVVLHLLKKYYPEIKDGVIHSGYFGTMDSVLLYSYIREFKPRNIMEIGGGTSSKVMFQALKKNGLNVKLNGYALKRTSDVSQAPDCVDYVFHEGDLLETFFKYPPSLEQLDFVFIDGAHESYFASFYCYEILEKLKPGTLIHIHDVQEPDVLLEGYEKGWWKLGEYCKNPTITDEIFTMYLYIKKQGGYKVLCKSNDLLEKNLDKVNFIHEVENCLYKNALARPVSEQAKSSIKDFFKRKEVWSDVETQASSFYMIKENNQLIFKK